MYSPEVTQKLAEWRRKVMDNSITKEDMQQAIILLRQGREAAAVQKKAAGKSPKKVIDTDALLADL
jgi:hypothetical protein